MLPQKALILLVFLFLAPSIHADTIFWLRGTDEMVFVDNSIQYSIHEVEPDEFSTTTIITKTTTSGTGEWVRFYHDTIDQDTVLSGSISVWVSSLSTSDEDAQMRFILYDHNPSSGSDNQIISSPWQQVPDNFGYQETVNLPTNYTIASGHMMKLVFEYDASAGTNLELVIDEGQSGKLLSWEAPNGETYELDGVNNTAALLVSAAGLPEIACSNSSECSDSNPTTVDICFFPGTYSSFCSHENQGCQIECSSDNACTSGSGGKCTNPGSCSSECEYSGQFFLDQNDCEIACTTDSQCNDNLDLTTDNCTNPGTCSAACSNSSCSIECTANSGCDDSNPITADNCANPGTCQAVCINTSCNPICSTNSDCNDSNPATTDVCAGAGRCTAICENLLNAGDGTCDAGETECSVPSDCGACGGSINNIYEYACIGNSCRQTIKLGVCGNDRCEAGESFNTCREDCKPANVAFLFGFPDNFYVRGETVAIKASLVVDSGEFNEATVRATGFFGDIPLYNDGKHDDGTRNDSIFANSFVISSTTPKELYPITVYTRIDDTEYRAAQFLNVSPKVSSKVGFDKPVYVLGDNIRLNGEIDLKENKLDLPISYKVFFDDELLDENTILTTDSKFTINHRTTLVDRDGNYTFTLESTDQNQNSLDITRTVRVVTPEATNFLVVEASAEKESYRKGETAKFNVKVSNIDGSALGGAKVTGLLGSTQLDFVDSGNGTYEADFPITLDTHSGHISVEIEAVKQNKQGAAETSFNVLPNKIMIEVLEPKDTESFQVGEEIKLATVISYENGDPVLSENVYAIFDGEKIVLVSSQKKGVYEGTYIIKNEAATSIALAIHADSGYGDSEDKSLLVEVNGVSYLHYIRLYGFSIALVIFAAALASIILFFTVKQRGSVSGLRKKEKQLLEKIKGIQTQYFVDGSIDKKSYDKYMEDFEPQLQDIRESLKQMERAKK